MKRVETSQPFYHQGDRCRIVVEGEITRVEVLIEIPGTGYGPWGEGRATRWVQSGYGGELFLSLEQMKISEERRHTISPREQTPAFVWIGQSCRLVRYGDERGLRIQMQTAVAHSGYGPFDDNQIIEWVDTFYNPEMFANLPLRWEKFSGNFAGRTR